MDPIRLLIQCLTYSGIIPFFLCFILAIQNSPGWLFILLAYGAVIQSFIAGMHWGISIEVERSVTALVISIILAIWAWFSVLLICYPLVAIIMQISGFLALFMVDYCIISGDNYPYQFHRLRQHVTLIVIIVLIAHIFLLPN
jgi:hypothetical protein